MYWKISFFLYVRYSKQFTDNTIIYPDNINTAFCSDPKQVNTMACQAVYKTQPSNVAVYPQHQVITNPVNTNNIGFVNPPVVQTHLNNVRVIPEVQPQKTTTVQSYPVIISTNPTDINTAVNPQLQNIGKSQITSTSPVPEINLLGMETGQKLSTVLNENPVARTQLINFLEYNGVPPPWDQLLDFETTQHHQLPNPETLFRKIRKQLLTFESIKTRIVEGLIVIEKYINRGKAYLAEDLKDLCRDKVVLNNILKRLRTKPTYEFRSELFKRYADVKARSYETQKSFYKLRDWLLNIKKLFSTL